MDWVGEFHWERFMATHSIRLAEPSPIPLSAVSPSQETSSNQLLLDGYLRREELAQQLGVSPRTIDRWQTSRCGPPRSRYRAHNPLQRGFSARVAALKGENRLAATLREGGPAELALKRVLFSQSNCNCGHGLRPSQLHAFTPASMSQTPRSVEHLIRGWSCLGFYVAFAVWMG